MDKLEPDETVKAWLAGFIDGDGYISITEKYGCNPHQLSPYFRIRVGITNISRAILRLVAIYFGGSVSSGWDSPDTKKHRVYSWTIQGNMARDLLNDILPYLKLKYQQAKLAIQFQDALTEYKYRHMGEKLDSQIIQLRLTYKLLIHRLNEPDVIDYNVMQLLRKDE